MIKFLIKGVLRDRNRSLLPIITVSIGAGLTVLLHAWLTGVLGDMIDLAARFNTGHVKVMTQPYAENIGQQPNDLAIIGVDTLLPSLNQQFPDMKWVQRINFGGLVDAPDEHGETKAQGPAMGLAVDLLSPNTEEIERLKIQASIVRGRLPEKPEQVLLSDTFAQKLEVAPGDEVTLLSSTMFGSMAMQNFAISGTVEFGITAMDRGAIIMDLQAARQALDMQNATGEILGYFSSGFFVREDAWAVAHTFNAQYQNSDDEFALTMLTLPEQNDLATMLDYVEAVRAFILVAFMIMMSIVLWNAGLLGGLRRYGEFGVRLAIGESKGQVYRSLIMESVYVGLVGSVFGTLIGLALAYYLQEVGFNVGDYTKNASMMIPNTFRANITPPAYFIGFIPGVLSTILGASLSGLGIYKRQTANLFKELET